MAESLTQKAAAERLGMSARQLRRLTTEGAVPRNDDGSYPWPEVQAAVTGEERLSQVEAAERLGITDRHLRRLTTEGAVTRLADGSYPWPRVREEHEAHLAEAEEARASGFGDDSYAEARARKTVAQARLAELEVREKEGALVAIEDVEAMLREPLERVNTTLKGVPSRHGPKLAKAAGIPLAQAKALLSEVVEAVRSELREIPEAPRVA